MLLLLLNVVVAALIATPLMLLEWGSHRVRWVQRNHDWLSIVLWLLTLAALYIWMLPFLGLRPNPRFRGRW